MNILQVNNLQNFNNIWFNKRNNSVEQKYGLKMADPLSKDTVSFKATSKAAQKALEANRSTVKNVRAAMQDSYKKINRMIDNLFADLEASEKYPKNPLSKISCRLKSEDSIKEKTGTREITSFDEITATMTDIIGTKLTIREPNKSVVDGILGRFIPLIKSGKLELLEIENKRPEIVKGLPESEASIYDYASADFLNMFADIQDTCHKKGGSKKRVTRHIDDDFTKANYCAIHFLFRVPGKRPVVFECQVIGENVDKAKTIDDGLYKKLNGKNFANSTPKFDALFEPFTNPNFFAGEENAEKIVEDAKKAINDYRGEVFLFQRNKAVSTVTKNKNKKEHFLPISHRVFPPEIEMKYKISSEDYDFNNLYNILQKGK